MEVDVEPAKGRENGRLARFVAHLVDPLPLGTFGSVLAFVGSLQANSAFTSKVPGSWFFGVHVHLVAGSGMIELLSNWSFYLGVVLTFVAWVKIIMAVARGESFRKHELWVVFVAWSIPLLLAGPLLSRDVYSYAAQGQMVFSGISPYKGGPAILRTSPYLLSVDPLWQFAPAPYGPFFLTIDSFFTTFARHSPLWTVVLLRLAAFGGVVMAGHYLPKIAAVNGCSKDLTFALFLLNPITLYDLVSAGHNDAWMVGLMCAGVYYALTRRTVLAIALITLGGAVKAPALGAIVFVGYNWGDKRLLAQKIRRTIMALAISGLVLLVLGYVTGLGIGWVKSLSTPGSVVSPADPVTAIATFLVRLASVVGVSVSVTQSLFVMRILGLSATGVFAVLVLLRADRTRMVRSLGLTLLVLVLLGPVVWPWYLTWGIALLAASVGTSGAYSIVVLSVLGFPLSLPGGGQSFTSWIVYVAASFALVVGFMYWRQWLPLSWKLVVDEIVQRSRWMLEREFGRDRVDWKPPVFRGSETRKGK